MKTTGVFKRTIQSYLEQRAVEDKQFAVRYALESKSIDDCINFILNTVNESGCNGFTDDEVFGMAVHYYDEDEVDPSYLKAMSCKTVVNHHPELTDEEKKELAEKAKKDYYDECLRKQKELINKPKKKEAEKEEKQQMLFDF